MKSVQNFYGYADYRILAMVDYMNIQKVDNCPPLYVGIGDPIGIED